MSRDFLKNDDFARLPMEHVLGELGADPPDSRGRYWCPHHDDRRPGGKPSAQVWADVGGDVLWCWSCGWSGSAVDVVMKTAGVDKRRARRRVAEMLKTAPERADPAPARPPPDGLEGELRRLTVAVRYPGGRDPLEHFARGRRLPGAEYLHEQWGWAGDYRGRMVMPHRAPSGELTGLRFRVPPAWEKRGRPGSHFRQLYGAWRWSPVRDDEDGVNVAERSSEAHAEPAAQVPGEVWLCEGETDTVRAAEDLERAGIGTALGLPGGTYRMRPDDAPFLESKRVVIAFDWDRTGGDAAARWTSDIAGIAASVYRLELPPGLDLCAVDDSPTELRGSNRIA